MSVLVVQVPFVWRYIVIFCKALVKVDNGRNSRILQDLPNWCDLIPNQTKLATKFFLLLLVFQNRSLEITEGDKGGIAEIKEGDMKNFFLKSKS